MFEFFNNSSESTAQLVAVINLVLLALILLLAVLIIKSKNLINTIIFLAAFSLLMALEYVLLAAPDVAITEAAVGAAVSTILILMAIFAVGSKVKSSDKNPIKSLLLFIVLAVLLSFEIINLPKFGNHDNKANQHVAKYYIEHTNTDMNVPNAVTSILAGYRAYDTFGELIVIFIAGIAVTLISGASKNPF